MKARRKELKNEMKKIAKENKKSKQTQLQKELQKQQEIKGNGQQQVQAKSKQLGIQEQQKVLKTQTNTQLLLQNKDNLNRKPKKTSKFKTQKENVIQEEDKSQIKKELIRQKKIEYGFKVHPQNPLNPQPQNQFVNKVISNVNPNKQIKTTKKQQLSNLINQCSPQVFDQTYDYSIHEMGNEQQSDANIFSISINEDTHDNITKENQEETIKQLRRQLEKKSITEKTLRVQLNFENQQKRNFERLLKEKENYLSENQYLQQQKQESVIQRMNEQAERNLNMVMNMKDELNIEHKRNQNYKQLLQEKEYLMESIKKKFNKMQQEQNSLKLFLEKAGVFMEFNYFQLNYIKSFEDFRQNYNKVARQFEMKIIEKQEKLSVKLKTYTNKTVENCQSLIKNTFNSKVFKSEAMYPNGSNTKESDLKRRRSHVCNQKFSQFNNYESKTPILQRRQQSALNLTNAVITQFDMKTYQKCFNAKTPKALTLKYKKQNFSFYSKPKPKQKFQNPFKQQQSSQTKIFQTYLDSQQ